MRRCGAVGLVLVLTVVAALCLPSGGGAQVAPPRIQVRVRQVAGTSVYLELGARHGLVTGDTLQVFKSDGGTDPIGRLVVTAGTESRSVLTFVGKPFPVTRGETLVFQLLRQPEELPPEEATAPQATSSAPPTVPVSHPASSQASVSPSAPALSAEPTRPEPHGRIGFDMSAVRSVTRVGASDPVDVSRTFATPAMHLDLTVPDAVGPLRFRTGMRVAYRYSDGDIVQPATSMRVYAASLEGEFDHVRVALGRFHSPVEIYSGYWDGALLRVGGRSLGMGAAAGFEPDRWNERPSTSIPKATVFVDGAGRGEGWRWSGDLSAHAVRPRNGEANHTFVGASQRFSSGSLRLGHDLQVDRDPNDGRWRISRLRIRASMDLGAGVQLRGGVARRESWIPELIASPFGARRDRADVGLAFSGEAGFLSLDASGSRDADGRRTWGATGSFMLDELPGLTNVGASGSVARWSGAYGTSLSAAPSLSFHLSPAWLRVGYRLNRSDYLGRSILTHAVEASVDAPFASGLRASGRLRAQLGGVMSSQSFSFTLYRIF